MWNFIKYTAIGLLVIFNIVVIVIAPQVLLLFALVMLPYGIGKLFSNRKNIEMPSLNEEAKQVIKKTGKSSVKAVGKAATFTNQKVILPFLRMMVDKLEAKQKYQSSTNPNDDKKVQDDLKESFKKRESEL